jgi:uncharacterized surface protein with fasciclin (FAS1) repeats
MTDKMNLIETIAKEDKFSTFSRLLNTSKAKEILSGEGEFTVLAPTNDAFGKVPDAVMNGWTSEKDQPRLKAVLAYHILPGKLTAANISTLKSTPTVAGSEVTFSDTNGLKVNTSGVQARNIEATNGIVHALDTVLTPPVKAVAAPSVL